MKLFLTTLFLLLSTQLATAQATAYFKASATIIQPIAISTISNLNFAEIDAREGGEIILSPHGERNAIGNVELADGSMVTAAAFEIIGDQDFSFSISLPTEYSELVNGSETMIIKDFTSSTGSTSNLKNGKTSFKVGATLEVNPQQTPGLYSTRTPLPITVNYN